MARSIPCTTYREPAVQGESCGGVSIILPPSITATPVHYYGNSEEGKINLQFREEFDLCRKTKFCAPPWKRKERAEGRADW